MGSEMSRIAVFTKPHRMQYIPISSSNLKSCSQASLDSFSVSVETSAAFEPCYGIVEQNQSLTLENKIKPK